jgi:hypothetical protein
MPNFQQSWARSQHPPTQWNLQGASNEAVLNKVHKKSKKSPFFYFPQLRQVCQDAAYCRHENYNNELMLRHFPAKDGILFLQMERDQISLSEC